MSEIVEKTIFSLQNLLTGPGNRDFLMSKNRDFQNLVEAVAGVTTKHEQDVIIQKELSGLQQKLGQPGVKLHQVRDCLVRVVYCEMLGYEAPFSYIHAIKLAQQGSLPDKRIGYLVATLFLNPEHELVILLINCIQKDLKSTNVFDVSMALTASVYLVNADMVHLIIDLIEEKLFHPKEMIRKKALLALQHFINIYPTMLKHVIPHLKRCIGDSDPEVVSSAIHAIYAFAKTDVSCCRDVVEPLVQVFKQVLNRKLPVDFDYHGLPAPWVQMQILKLFALLGHGDMDSSTLMYDIMEDVLGSVDVNHSIGYAVLYECVSAAISIYPNTALLKSASSVIDKFLKSHISNMKYMGLKALSAFVTNVHPAMATDHQDIVMKCLRHPDDSIRGKTLDVLFCLTNAANIQIVCSKILEHLTNASDEYAQTEIIRRVLEIIERHSADPNWSVFIVNDLILKSTPAALPSCIQLATKLVYEGDENLKSVRVSAVETYVRCLRNRSTLKLPREVVLFFVSVIGDYYYICSAVTAEDTCNLLDEMLTIYLNDVDIVNAILMFLKTLLIHSMGISMPHLWESLKCCMSAAHPVIRQQAFELSCIIKNTIELRDVYQGSTNKEHNQAFDWTLTFLDSLVLKALECDSDPYKPESLRKKSNLINVDLHLSEFGNHQYDFLWAASTISSKQGLPSLSSQSVSSENVPINTHQSLKLPLNNVKRIWNKDGCDFQSKESIEHSLNTVNFSAKFTSATLPERNLQSQHSEAAQDADFAKALFGSLSGSISSSTLGEEVANSACGDFKRQDCGSNGSAKHSLGNAALLQLLLAFYFCYALMS